MHVKLLIRFFSVVVIGILAFVAIGVTAHDHARETKTGQYTITLKSSQADQTLKLNSSKVKVISKDQKTIVATMPADYAKSVLSNDDVAYMRLDATYTVTENFSQSVRRVIDEKVSEIRTLI